MKIRHPDPGDVECGAVSEGLVATPADIDGNSDVATNTTAGKVTGHPEIGLPCGVSAGLPVGIMLVLGRHSDQSSQRPGSTPVGGFDYEPPDEQNIMNDRCYRCDL